MSESTVISELQDELRVMREQIGALTEELTLFKRHLFWAETTDFRRGDRPDRIYCADLRVFNMDSQSEIKLSADENGASIVIFGPEQRGVISLSVDADNGITESPEPEISLMSDVAGQSERRVSIGQSQEGGVISLYGAGDQPYRFMMSEEEKARGAEPTTAICARLGVSEGAGYLNLNAVQTNAMASGRVWLNAKAESAELILSPGNGAIGAQIQSDGDGSRAYWCDKAGTAVVVLGQIGDSPSVELRNEKTIVARMGTQNGSGSLVLNQEDGTHTMGLLSQQNENILAIFGPDGERRVSLTGAEDGAHIEAATGNRMAEITLKVDSESTLLRLNGVDLKSGFVAQTSTEGTQTTIHDGEGIPTHIFGPGPTLMLCAEDMQPRVMMTAQNQGGRLDLLSEESRNQATLEVSGQGGRLDLRDAANEQSISAYSGEEGNALTVWNGEGVGRAVELKNSGEGGAVSVYRQDQELGARLTAREEGGALDLFDEQGQTRTS